MKNLFHSFLLAIILFFSISPVSAIGIDISIDSAGGGGCSYDGQ